MSIKFKREVFSKDLLTMKVGPITCFSKYPAQSEVGLELELEGFGAYFMPEFVGTLHRPYWTTHSDPSLRGESCELVLRRPVSFTELKRKVIPEYVKIIKSTNFIPALSNRCSFHVHLDFSAKTYYALLRFTILYAIYELYLFAAVGPHRRGNHFCVSLDEAEGFVDKLINAFTTGKLSICIDENYRYMAYNLQSLYKFGSVELRLHQGVSDPKDIQDWVDVLEEMLRYADTNWEETPTELLEQISMNGLLQVTKLKFPKLYNLICPKFNTIFGRTGLDIAQDIAYAASWENAPREPVKFVEPKISKKRAKEFIDIEQELTDLLNAEREL